MRAEYDPLNVTFVLKCGELVLASELLVNINTTFTKISTWY